MHRLALLGSTSLLLAFLSSCESSQKPTLLVTLAPYHTFAKAIAGDAIHSELLIPPGSNPHTWEPKPEQMKSFANAKLLIVAGGGIESGWVHRFQSMNSSMQLLSIHQGSSHHHHDEPHESHPSEESHSKHEDALEQAMDPHLWTSPKAMLQVIPRMVQAITAFDSAHAQDFTRRGDSLLNVVRNVDLALRQLVDSLPEQQRRFIVYHPSYGQLAKDYGLVQTSVEKNGKEPRPADLAAMIDELKQSGTRALLLQPQFPRSVAETIAKELGAKTVATNPLDADWVANLNSFMEALRQ